MVDIDARIGKRAAELPAQHGLTLTDALQLSTAMLAGCDAFLTNDRRLLRVTEAHVVVVEDLLQP